MHHKNVHFRPSKGQESRSLSCVYKMLQQMSFCKTMLPIVSPKELRSWRKRPILSHKAYFIHYVTNSLQTYGSSPARIWVKFPLDFRFILALGCALRRTANVFRRPQAYD